MRRLGFLTILLLTLLLFLPLNLLMAGRTQRLPLPVPVVVGHGDRMANVDIAGLSADEAIQRLQQVAGDGISIVRLRLPWAMIQPQPDRWQWQVADAAMQQADALSIDVVLLLDGAPAWAVKPEDQGNELAPPHDPRDFGHFAAAVAERYGASTSIYQLWDEPNIQPHWGARWADPRGYMQLLREGANSIQRLQPEARIMLASLAPTVGDGTANLSDIDYLEALYRYGAAEYFDLAAAAAFGFNQVPDAEPQAASPNFRRPELIYEILAENGDGHKPLWITSWGWWTAPSAAASDTSPWGAIEASLLGDYQQQGWQLAQSRWPWAGPMAWIDYALNPGDSPLRGGLTQRTAGRELTPAGAGIISLGEQTLPAATGSHAADAATIQYLEDAWRRAPSAADPKETDATLVFPFQGRSIALEVQRGWYWATLTAEIDGDPAPLLPQDNRGNAFINLHDPENGVEMVALARDLNPGLHELKIVASGGWGQWPLRRIIVDHNVWAASWPFLPLTAVWLLALLAVGVFWIRSLRQAGGRHVFVLLAGAWDQVERRSRSRLGRWSFPLAALICISLYFSPNLLLSLFLLMLLALFLAIRTDLAPVLILLVLPFYVKPKLIGPIGVSLHEMILWLGAGWWLLRWLIDYLARRQAHEASAHTQMVDGGTEHQSIRLGIAGLDWPILVLLVIAFFATFAAERTGVAVYELRTVLLAPVLFYWLIVRTQTGRALDLPLLSDALVLGALAISLIGLYQFVAGGATFVEGVPRISALYGSPNNLALYLGRVLPLLLVLPVLGTTPRRWLYLAALIPIMLAALLTFSKGLLLISVPFSLILLFLLAPRMRKAVLGYVVLGVLALLPFLSATRFTDLFNTRGGTTFLRLQLWRSAWQMFRDHPWLGVGPDNFLYSYRSRYALPTAWEELQLSHPHNVFLDLLTRLGLLGFLAGGWLLVAALVRGFKHLRSFEPRQDDNAANEPVSVASPAPLALANRPFYLALLVGFTAGLAHGLIDNSLFLIDLAILSYFVFAMIERLWREGEGVLEIG